MGNHRKHSREYRTNKIKYKIMKWITIKLMNYQTKKAKKQFDKEKNYILKKAMRDMIESYKDTVMFIKANK